MEYNLTLGILAHVDAGKTTLAEAMLYQTGSIRTPGRVDHKDAFLDNYALERARGITIFSKQAGFQLGRMDVTLLDTPGHTDFSAEMERTLQVLDYAVLVISGADGVQGHVRTLWKLLERYEIPVFLFINKMDQDGTDAAALLAQLQESLSVHCLDFTRPIEDDVLQEDLAVCDEALLDAYLEGTKVDTSQAAALIKERKIFPCYFGSALKMEGVDKLLSGLEDFAICPQFGRAFGARVYKISRDELGNRLTHMKITGGILRVKMPLTNSGGSEADAEGLWEEKVEQIRRYAGASYEAVSEAAAGSVCAVTGLKYTRAGQGLGADARVRMPLLAPVLTYEIKLPDGCDAHLMLQKLRQLEEEEPQLHIVWDETHGEIHAQLMGEVQIDVLKHIIMERFGVAVEFGDGSIVYQETITNTVEGIGHFEPLRHYAEVHLLMEPSEPGSGLQYNSICSDDILERNWQRLILTHLKEKKHRGVLTGVEITDMKITLAAGRAHKKHTEGGDFRQATYRAVRQGLRKAESVLLEPVYEFYLELPAETVGRAMADIQKMHGNLMPPVIAGERAILTGSAPVVTMRGYQTEVLSYTKGQGRLSCELKGYEPCHNAEEIIAAAGYNAEEDLDNPTGSVFCSHGAGCVVPWHQVEEHMHLDSILAKRPAHAEAQEELQPLRGGSTEERYVDEAELEAIFTRTYGAVERKKSGYKKKVTYHSGSGGSRRSAGEKPKEQYLLVDGYNIIFAWDELRELAEVSVDGARGRLMDILSNYQGYKGIHLILVFDAYKVKGNPGEVSMYHNIHVVYTKEAETADQYIEKTVHEIGKKYDVTVATSDALEQMIILGQGARRMSARGLWEEVQAMEQEVRENWLNGQ